MVGEQGRLRKLAAIVIGASSQDTVIDWATRRYSGGWFASAVGSGAHDVFCFSTFVRIRGLDSQRIPLCGVDGMVNNGSLTHNWRDPQVDQEQRQRRASVAPEALCSACDTKVGHAHL